MKSRSICPYCKAVLEFDRAIIKMVKCPKCSYEGNVEIFTKFEQGTYIPEKQTGKTFKPGKLEYIKSDAQWLQIERTVNLLRGINTIGRISPNSECNIQIPVTDFYMSKENSTIDVIMKVDGVFEHRLSDKGSKNGTFHNGERLEKGDVIKLVNGDVIKMGHTLLKFIN